MALVGGRSTLNPNAPLFVPSFVRQVEDFSPEWWNLVTTSTWFHDYWMSQNQGEEYGVGNDVADLLPENIDLNVDEDILNMEAQFEEFLQYSESGQQGVKPSLYGANGMPQYVPERKLAEKCDRVPFSPFDYIMPAGLPSDELMRTLSSPRSPIGPPPKYFEKPAKIVSPRTSFRSIQQPR